MDPMTTGAAHRPIARRSRQHSGARIGILAGLIVMQLISALFFVGDVTADFMAIGLDPHTTYEGIATLSLMLGVVFGALEMWRTLRRGRRAELALDMARGAFGEVLKNRFDHWQLTTAEAEVALLVLKGFDNREIADLRGRAEGTVRAQTAGIYAKSGTRSRSQFISVFIDALLDDPPAQQQLPQGGATETQ